MSKYIRDFKSQVTCLPGPAKHENTRETGRLGREKKQEPSDIFFLKKSSSIVGEMPQNKKIVRKNIESNEAENLERKKKTVKPVHIRNVFESQIFK